MKKHASRIFAWIMTMCICLTCLVFPDDVKAVCIAGNHSSIQRIDLPDTYEMEYVDENGGYHYGGAAGHLVIRHQKLVCSECEEVIDEDRTSLKDYSEAHVWDENGVCIKCEYVRQIAPACSHDEKKPGSYIRSDDPELDPNDNSQHIIRNYYAVVCSNCGEALEGEMEGEPTYAPHTFNGEGVCTACNYECTHPEESYVERPLGSDDPVPFDEEQHSITEYYRIKCGICGKTVTDEQEKVVYEDHVFDNNGTCTECGYAKSPNPEELKISLSVNPTTVEVGGQFIAVVTVTGGVGDVNYYWVVTCEGKEVRNTNVAGPDIDLTAEEAGEYVFTVTVSDENGTQRTATATVTAIPPVECEHENTEPVYTDPGYEQIEGDEENHNVYRYYDVVCSDCGEHIETHKCDGPEPEAHHFDENGTCSDCGYVKAAPSDELRAFVDVDQTRAFVGESLGASATVTGGDGQYKIAWKITRDGVELTTTPIVGPRYNYPADEKGIYVFTVIVVDGKGNQTSASGSEIEVIEEEELKISVTADQISAKAGDWISATATVTGGIGEYSFEWRVSRDGETIDETDNYISSSVYGLVADAEGTYMFTVSVRDSKGNSQSDDSELIIVDSAPCNHKPVFVATGKPVYSYYDDTTHIKSVTGDIKCAVCGIVLEYNATDESPEEHVPDYRDFYHNHPHQLYSHCKYCGEKTLVRHWNTANGKIQSPEDCCICHGHVWGSPYQEAAAWYRQCIKCNLVEEIQNVIMNLTADLSKVNKNDPVTFTISNIVHNITSGKVDLIADGRWNIGTLDLSRGEHTLQYAFNTAGYRSIQAVTDDGISNTVNIEVIDQDKEMAELEEQFRKWALEQSKKYRKLRLPYYDIAKYKPSFDGKWAEDKKPGSTNQAKNANYDQETKNFYLVVANLILQEKTKEISLSLEDYVPGMVFDAVKGEWETDITGEYMNDKINLNVDQKLKEKNAKLAADAARLGSDIGMTLAKVKDPLFYKLKNRAIDAVRNITIESDKIDIENERAILANFYRDQLIESVANSVENINDDIFDTFEKQRDYLEAKRNRNKDEELELEVLNQIVDLKQNSQGIIASMNNQTTSYNGKTMTVDEAMKQLAEEVVTEIGNNEKIEKTEKEISLLKTVILIKESLKAVLKACILDKGGVADQVSDALKNTNIVARMGASVTTAMSTEIMIDVVVDSVVDKAAALAGLDTESDDTDALALIQSFMLETIDNYGGNVQKAISIRDRILTMEKTINQKYNKMIEQYREESMRNLDYYDDAKKYIDLAEGARRNELSEINQLYQKQKDYYAEVVEDKALLGGNDYKGKYYETIRQRGGFLGSFIGNSIQSVVDIATSLVDVDFWSEFGDVYDEDPYYSSIANQTYRVWQYAEQAIHNLLHNYPEDFYRTGDINAIAEEINTMHSIVQYHVQGNTLYADLAVACALEKDPAHRQEIYDRYMNYKEELDKKNDGNGFYFATAWTFKWAIDVVGKMDADSQSEFFKYLKNDKRYTMLSISESEQVVNETIDVGNNLVIPSVYAPLFQNP